MVMLRIKGVVQMIDLTSTAPQLACTTHLLSQLDTDLQQAVLKVSSEKCEQPSLDAEHTKFIKCFATLATALVAKLVVQGSSCRSAAGHHNSKSSCKGSSLADMFDVLWNLLHTTCNAFSSWPRNWPLRDTAEYQSLRVLMYRLMLYILHITRTGSTGGGTASGPIAGVAPDHKHNQTMAILYVPLSYITSIVHWPDSNIMGELAALPSDFFAASC